MNALLVSTKPATMQVWREELLALDPALDIRLHPESGPVEDITAAVTWNHPPEDLYRYPNLKLLISMGAGVDHLFRPPGPPPGVAVVRLVDRLLTTAMSEYVLLAVLRHHRQDAGYRALQARREWEELPAPDTEATRIGVMGLGNLGADAARKLAALNFQVAGWSRTPKQLDGIETFAGADGLMPFLARTDILVCLLPLTPETEGIINARTLAGLPHGAYVINAARGAHVVEEDLLAALDSGQVSGATLDVFRTEPLPREHRFWTHPNVILTPHAASITIPRSVAPQVIDNLARLREGRPLANVVDVSVGY
ncbi:2-hydroxyacid dehydrogenase [Elioraea rosea]|uniref:2-hydroxyacid dehydrogenase n=1 Tax=Elioraea rosea TaxID=2492390 RepID=UPI00118369A4|nr:glyoxylate/hydroxypyruvate reductase A [Elioraea rosea]